MNKAEMGAKLAKQTGISQAKAVEVLSALFGGGDGAGLIADTLASGEKVSVTGFGKFEPRKRKARDGTNPATGAPLHIPAKTVVNFSAGKNLKDRVA